MQVRTSAFQAEEPSSSLGESTKIKNMSLSSSRSGHRPFKPVTRVRTPLGTPKLNMLLSSNGLGYLTFNQVISVRIRLGEPNKFILKKDKKVLPPPRECWHRDYESWLRWFESIRGLQILKTSLSSSWLGHRPFKPVTRVRIPLGTPN